MTRKRKRISLIDLFRKKPANRVSTAHDSPLHNEIIVTEHGTISLKSMVLTAKRQGNFYVGEAVTVEADGYITGTIVATDGVIKGRIKGSLTCVGELTIKPTAIIEGAVTAKRITIEPGSIINGTLSISDNTQEALLAEKLQIAKALLGDGYEPAIEPVDLPESATPYSMETLKSEVRQKEPGPKNAKTKPERSGQFSPDEEAPGNWW